MHDDLRGIPAANEDGGFDCIGRGIVDHICRDPDDDEVLAVAATAKADAIVTGDKDLLTLKSNGGIPILSPRQLVELLDRLK